MWGSPLTSGAMYPTNRGRQRTNPLEPPAGLRRVNVSLIRPAGCSTSGPIAANSPYQNPDCRNLMIDCASNCSKICIMNDVFGDSALAANGWKCPKCLSSMKYVGTLPSIGLWPRQLVYRCPACNQIVRDTVEAVAPSIILSDSKHLPGH